MNTITKLIKKKPKRAVPCAINCHVSSKPRTEPDDIEQSSNERKKPESKRMAQFRQKLKETGEFDQPLHPAQKIKLDTLPPWPNDTNPHTGEIGGPRGPEPTRYGDWERNGICIDF